jgi:general stress protein 26
MPIKDYEDVTVYGLDADQEAELLAQQNECTFCWTTRDGSPMAVIMSYVYHHGRFWLTASGQRKRVPAVRRDGRVAVVITSSGTDVGAGRAVSYKGTARVLDDAVSKEWFYPALAERLVGHLGPARVAECARFLDSPRRVILEVTPGVRVGFDGSKMHALTEEARAAGMNQ